MPDDRERYEALRCQVLKPVARGTICAETSDIAFIESQGVAAWLERGMHHPVSNQVATERPQPVTGSLAELVILLANWMAHPTVEGDPNE